MTVQLSRARKWELLDLNRRAWSGEQDVFKTAKSLDSSLKKNTGVIKRLRSSINSESIVALVKDIQTISLEKYLPEVISAVDEGLRKSKIADCGAVVEVISALHQRFQREFTPKLTLALVKGLANPKADTLKHLSQEQKEREEKERLARQRVLLRVTTELWLVGVIRSKRDAISADDGAITNKVANVSKQSAPALKKEDGEEGMFPMEALKELLGKDREHVNLPLVVAFVKQFAYDLFGMKARTTTRKNVEEDGLTSAVQDLGKDTDERNTENGTINSTDDTLSPLLSDEMHKKFRDLILKYFESVKKHLINEHQRLQKQQIRNAEAYIKSGEIFEDRQSTFEKSAKVQEKFVANAQVVADVLGFDMPDLPDDKNEEAQDSIIREGGSMFTSKGEEGRAGIWEDEDQRKFYEELVDLKIKVPPILLEDGKKKKKDGDERLEMESKKASEESETRDGPKRNSVGDASFIDSAEGLGNGEDIVVIDEPVEDASTAIVNKTVGAQVDALLIRLPDFTNRDLIDQAAIDFCFLNSKASRNRLVKVLYEVPRARQDLLPYYSRLVATLNKYLPDIGAKLVELLNREFHSLQRRKEKDLSESRARNVRYLSELTKFGVVPQHVTFHCLKVALEDFHRVNIDNIANILENCGRYLLKNPETGPRMGIYLETLKKKKDSVTFLGPQERVALENAFYYVNPPDRPAIVQKERSVMELFLRKLIYLDLTKRNYIKILKQLRKLNWEDPTINSLLKTIFTKIWKVRYNNIHILAIIVGALQRYHQKWAYGIIDEILEQITVGLEQNNFKHNQRRVAQVKYLGELYNYKTIDSPVIFDALYRIVMFGHTSGTPKPSLYCPLDPPDDYFRIRLVCSLLDVCGGCFDRGAAKKKLDFFLTFFQYYIFTKEPCPMEIDFLVQDTFAAVRPTLKLHTNFDEAAKAFAEAVQKNYSPVEEGKTTEVEDDYEDDDISEDEAELRDEEGDGGEEGDGLLADEEEAASAAIKDLVSASGSEIDSEEEEDLDVVTREIERDPEADAEFDREYAKMMQESLDSRKFERKPVFDVPLPIRKSTTVPAAQREQTMELESGDVPSSSQTSPGEGMMMFSLLTRRGNRQQTRTVAIPDDSQFVVAMREKREKDIEEKQKIKELVMRYDNMSDDSEKEGLERHAALNGYQIRMEKERRNQPRSRKLSMSDVNWYADSQKHNNRVIGTRSSAPIFPGSVVQEKDIAQPMNIGKAVSSQRPRLVKHVRTQPGKPSDSNRGHRSKHDADKAVKGAGELSAEPFY